MLAAVHPVNPQPRTIRMAAQALADGYVVAYPTASVYALGASVHARKAQAELYQLKQMPKTKALSLMCRDLSEASHYAVVHNTAHALMRQLAGPYTFVLPATRHCPRTLTHAKRRTVGIRLAENPVCRALLDALDAPLVTTSATFQGRTFLDARDIAERWPRLPWILDVGVVPDQPSTVIDLSGDEPILLRAGAGPTTGLALSGPGVD